LKKIKFQQEETVGEKKGKKRKNKPTVSFLMGNLLITQLDSRSL